MKTTEEILAALEDYRGWRRDRSEFDLLDYVGCVATPDLFFAFGALFAPELVLHDREYYLRSHFTLAAYDAWRQKLADPVAIQKVMNHIHVSTLFQDQEVAPALARATAERLAQVWSEMFRHRGLVAEACGSGLDDAEVTLFRAPRDAALEPKP